MDRRLDIEVQGARLVLRGRIDDTANVLGEAAARLPDGDVTIDTDAVTFVNSVGMREWMRLVRALRARGVVSLERVADVLMTQINLRPELGESVRIESFHAPYECPACGCEDSPVVDAKLHAVSLAQLVAPRLPCPECGQPMDLGDFPEKYLGVFRPQS